MRMSFLIIAVMLFLGSCNNEQNNAGATQNTMPKEVLAITKKIDAEPTNPLLYYERARVYRMLELDSLALRDLTKSASLDSTNSKYFSAIGDLLFDKKDISGSVKWFQKAIRINPRDEVAHLKIANIFLFSKDYPKAFAEINLVLQQNVYNAEAYFIKGLCYKDMGEIDRAISSFQTAVQTEPKYYDGFMQLGVIYSSKKDPLAAQYFDNAIRLDSMNMEAHYAKGMFYQSQNLYEDAKKVFKQALKVDRNYAEAHYNIGWMLLQQDSTEKALREFTRVIVLDQDNARAYYNKGLCYEILGENEKAKEDYEQALVFDPTFDLPIAALERVKKK